MVIGRLNTVQYSPDPHPIESLHNIKSIQKGNKNCIARHPRQHPVAPFFRRWGGGVVRVDHSLYFKCTLTWTRDGMEAIFLTFFRQVNKRVGEMHHRRQTDRFRGLGMFTRRCRLLRPQPESERRDGHRRPLGGNRILTRLRRRDGQPLSPSSPFPPQRPSVPIMEYCHQRRATPTQEPFVGVGTGSDGLMSSVHIHVHYAASGTFQLCRRHKSVLSEGAFFWGTE